MVSLKSENVKKYISRHIQQSLLLRCFCHYLSSDPKMVTTADKEKLLEEQRDYKLIAAQGYLASLDKAFQEPFIAGMQRLSGRSFSEGDDLLFDNVSLLGIGLGVKSLSAPEELSNSISWMNNILDLKERHHREDTDFFRHFIEGKTSALGTSDTLIQLEVFNCFLQQATPGPDSLLTDYYQKLRLAIFPYYEEDFFRNMVDIYNEITIQKSYILSRDDFEKEIQKAQDQASEITIIPIKEALDIQAKNLADLVFIFCLIILVTAFTFACSGILSNDWDFLEPRTYLFGLPLVFYILQGLYTVVFHRELNLKPKLMMERLINWNKKRLYRKYNIPSKYQKAFED